MHSYTHEITMCVQRVYNVSVLTIKKKRSIKNKNIHKIHTETVNNCCQRNSRRNKPTTTTIIITKKKLKKISDNVGSQITFEKKKKNLKIEQLSVLKREPM